MRMNQFLSIQKTKPTIRIETINILKNVINENKPAKNCPVYWDFKFTVYKLIKNIMNGRIITMILLTLYKTMK